MQLNILILSREKSILLLINLFAIRKRKYKEMIQINEMRLQLIECTQSQEIDKAINNFVNSLKNEESTTGLSKAYYAVSMAFKAKRTINPIKKINYLNVFHSKITEAVIEEQNSFESIFLRYLIQSRIPFGLGFSESIVKDEQFLKQNLAEWNPEKDAKEFKKYVIDFMNQKSN